MLSDTDLGGFLSNIQCRYFLLWPNFVSWGRFQCSIFFHLWTNFIVCLWFLKFMTEAWVNADVELTCSCVYDLSEKICLSSDNQRWAPPLSRTSLHFFCHSGWKATKSWALLLSRAKHINCQSLPTLRRKNHRQQFFRNFDLPGQISILCRYIYSNWENR